MSACRASPSPASDDSLAELGVDRTRIKRWTRGVDTHRFDPAKRDPSAYPGEVKVLYAGRLTTEKGVELLADAFLSARERDDRLHLLLAGDGPEEDALRRRLGWGSRRGTGGQGGEAPPATFLGWLDGEDLARAYASADMFLFCSRTDTFGQVILEAQASGLPVVAVDAGGPSSLIQDGRSGRLRPADAEVLAEALLELSRSEVLRDRLSRGGLAAVRERTWERALEELAEGYTRTLAGPGQASAPLRRAA